MRQNLHGRPRTASPKAQTVLRLEHRAKRRQGMTCSSFVTEVEIVGRRNGASLGACLVFKCVYALTPHGDRGNFSQGLRIAVMEGRGAGNGNGEGKPRTE